MPTIPRIRWILPSLVAAGLALLSVPWMARFAGGVTAPEGLPTHGEEVRIQQASDVPASSLQTATLGGGCFWCLEAVFQEVAGVQAVVSGYSGDDVTPAPLFGHNGPAEVVHITFDPQTVSYSDLLEIYWRVHDPTTVNRQGPDVGTKYRSVIFYHNEEQREIANAYKQQLDKSGAFANPVVTAIEPFEDFTPAESFHQNFFANRPDVSYCRAVIAPKLEKFRGEFSSKLGHVPED